MKDRKIERGKPVDDRLAKWLYSKLEAMQKKPDRILYNSAVREDLQALEPASDTPKRQKEYVIKKLSVCSLIMVCGVVLSAALWITDGMATKIVDNQIERTVYGDGSKSVSLIIFQLRFLKSTIHRRN